MAATQPPVYFNSRIAVNSTGTPTAATQLTTYLSFHVTFDTTGTTTRTPNIGMAATRPSSAAPSLLAPWLQAQERQHCMGRQQANHFPLLSNYMKHFNAHRGSIICNAMPFPTHA